MILQVKIGDEKETYRGVESFTRENGRFKVYVEDGVITLPSGDTRVLAGREA